MTTFYKISDYEIINLNRVTSIQINFNHLCFYFSEDIKDNTYRGLKIFDSVEEAQREFRILRGGDK